jgi:hypothetical protein
MSGHSLDEYQQESKFHHTQAALSKAACVAYARACIKCCEDSNTTLASCAALCRRYEACKKDFVKTQNMRIEENRLKGLLLSEYTSDLD